MTTPQDAASPPDAEHDDDALSWGDESDATYVDAPQNDVLQHARTKKTRGGQDGHEGSGALVGMGVFGGLYLLYTVAWLISASVLPVSGGSSLSNTFAEVLRVLAIMAPAFWFVATLWLGRTSSNRARFVWLLVGAVVLIPWPFIMTRSF
jgi:hypothetical protein